MQKTIYLQKGREKINLITDAMRDKCLKDGMYELGEQKVN